jgi:hypothetical protein
MRIQVVGRSYEDLAKYGVPPQGQPEAVPWYWFDTQAFASAATAGFLNFFQAIAGADPTTTNMPMAAQFPTGEYFWPQYVTLDVLSGPTISAAGTVVGAIDDVNRLISTTHPTIAMQLRSKQYGPWPARLAHCSGGAVGVLAGTFAPTTDIQQALNGVMDGGLCVLGLPMIPPTTRFVWSLFWNAVVTIVATPVNLVLTQWGCHYRPVS